MAHLISIKKLTRTQIVGRMKDAGVTQRAIAKRVGVTQAFVSNVIARRAVLRPTVKSEDVWLAIEWALRTTNGRRAG